MEQDQRREAIAVTLPQQRQTVLWIIAVLLAIIATVLVVQPDQPFAVQTAYGDAPMMGARGVFAFTGQLDKNSQGLWMMDVDSGNVWCYQYLPATRRLKLVAARSFLYDRHLKNYNNDGPLLDEVRDILEEERRIEDRNARGGVASDEDGALGTHVPGFPASPDDSDETRKD